MTNKEFFISRWQRELKTTLSAIKSLPDNLSTLGYKPHELSRSAYDILTHILPHVEGLLGCIDSGLVVENGKEFANMQEAQDYYENYSTQLIERLQSVADDEWENKVVTLVAGGARIFDTNMGDMFWNMLFDTVHHRGQLSTYYRAMGVRNPQIYGPTAEDMEAFILALSERQEALN